MNDIIGDIKLTSVSSNALQLLITVQLFKQRRLKMVKSVLIGINVNCYINNHYH